MPTPPPEFLDQEIFLLDSLCLEVEEDDLKGEK